MFSDVNSDSLSGQACRSAPALTSSGFFRANNDRPEGACLPLPGKAAGL